MAHVKTAIRPPPPRSHGDTLQPPSSPQRSISSIASSSPDARHVRLIAASGQANESRVREILAEDPSWSSSLERDALRQSLQKVAGRGNVPVTRLLLEKGADVEPRRELEHPALFKAAEAGHVGVVTLLLEHGANPNVRVRMRFHQTPLFVACFRGHNKVVELLLEHKADVNIRDKEGRTPLLFMVAERDRAKWTMETLVLLLGRGGADREARDNTGRTPLLWAATNGNQDAVEALLDNNVGGTVANVSATNNRGRTALHLAAEDNLHAMVRLLLDHKADPNAISDGGWTALHNAAQNGHHDVVNLLLAQNVNVNAELSNGMTALHWAAFNGHEAVVGQLLKHDQTRTDLKDSFDRTPMLCAAAGFHTEIVRMLSPERTAYRLSEAARLACEECKATVVDFGSFKGDKKQLVSKPSVYDVLYGWEMDPDHPKGSGRPKVSTQVKNIRFKPDFRWIHLPANNIAWAEALLSKWFVEGKHTDVEHFKSLERCFYQEHRGPFAHANYMRTYCDRFPVFHDQGSFSSSHYFTTVVEEPSDLSSVPSTLASNTPQGAGNVGVGPGAEAGPSSPRRPGVQDVGEGGSLDKEPGSKKKSKSEQLAERHPRRRARAHGPPGNPPGTKAQKMAARNNALSVVDSSRLPELNGKIVLFMPYLHYETDERRQRMSQVIDSVRSGTGNPDGLGPVRDVMLAKGYLCSTPPLHPRRTLDQFFYRGIDTSNRDTDQVVYRYCQRHNLEKKIFMVDQLWLWILGKDLVVTCFPQRWDQPSHDPFNVVDGIIEETNAKTRTPLQSVYELAMLITSRCSGMFDRHRLSDQDYHFLDMFEGSIGLVTNTESELFNRFNKASEKSAQWLSQYTSSPRRRHISSLMSSPPSSFTLDSDEADEDEDGAQASTVEFSDALLDIGTETALLAEIKDIRDELNILNVLLTAQKATLLTFENKISDELGSAGNAGGAFVSTKPMAAEIRKRSGDQLRLLETHCYDIERMDKQAESIYVSLTNLLDLKQKHSNALEARYARINAAFAARQGQTVLTFTIVTILFLPMSFIASFFSIQFKDLEDRLYVGYVSKYTFGIGLGISIPLIVMAFTARDILHAARGIYATMQKSGYLLSLVSGKNKASQARQCGRPETSGGGGGGGGGTATATATAVVSCMRDHERDPIGSRSGIGSSHNPPNNQRYSYGYSRYDSVNNDGLDQLRRLSSNSPRQPPQYSSLPQHQLQSPPKWLLTAGNSTMRVRNNSVAPNTSSHDETRGDVGAAGGFTYIREHNHSIGSSVGALGRIGHGRPSNDLEKGFYS